MNDDPNYERMRESIRQEMARCTIPWNYGTFPDLRWEERDWACVGVIYGRVWLDMQCRETGARGAVKDPSTEEWKAAGPQMTFNTWLDAKRVTILKEGYR